MVRDWFTCARSNRKGIPGAKPHGFNRWILELLNFDPEVDTLDDLFPGSGGMSKAVAEQGVNWRLYPFDD